MVKGSFSDFQRILKASFPFRYLTSEERELLEDESCEHFFAQGSVIIPPDCKGTGDLFFVRTGTVMTYMDDEDEAFKIHVVQPGHFFGEQIVLFDLPYSYGFRAKKDTVCVTVPGQAVLRLLGQSRSLAHSWANSLRDAQGVFAPFDRFQVELMRGVTQGTLDLNELLPYYQSLEPALHFGAGNSQIDFDGLLYAVRRLPENVTSTFAYLLTDDLPTEFSTPDQLFKNVVTAARRRSVWEMMAGKNMVLLRSGFSDLFDILTCLCVYAVEAGKIRSRMHNPKLIIQLEKYISARKRDYNNAPDPEGFLQTLPFSEDEVKGMMQIWPHDTAERLHQIVRHQEVVNLSIRRQVHNYKVRRNELWTSQIADAARRLLGVDPVDLPPDIRVHIISSNSHSVTNCLNPYLMDKQTEILEWGKRFRPEITEAGIPLAADRIYALARDYLKEAVLSETLPYNEADWGIRRLEETAATGIQVQLIDLGRLKGHPVDPHLSEFPTASRAIIVNIDYAFGDQAEDMIRNLIMLFGHNLASINILGKAGALKGRRGDILGPTAFIEQSSDLFYPLRSRESFCTDRLQELMPERSVFCGPMLTVSGTLLQNRVMLNFYHRLWNCIGLEMEGVYYLRQIREAFELGVISAEVDLRFFYYVSDLPMQTEQTLSVPLGPGEGIPPLYGITREILSSIFDQEREFEK